MWSAPNVLKNSRNILYLIQKDIFHINGILE